MRGPTVRHMCRTERLHGQHDHALGPLAAQILAAMAFCSAGDAFCGKPVPPYAAQVEGMIWYAPPAPLLGLTAW